MYISYTIKKYFVCSLNLCQINRIINVHIFPLQLQKYNIDIRKSKYINFYFYIPT